MDAHTHTYPSPCSAALLIQCISQEGQGRPHLFCDMRIVDDAGRVLPCDGKAIGHLQASAPYTPADCTPIALQQSLHKHMRRSAPAVCQLLHAAAH